jgi:GT2 family glycosyltransferase
MAVSRRVFERIGGFDPELGPGITGGGEESLLSWQIKQAGFRLVGAADVQIEHHLNPDRLCYKNWTKAADLKGQTRAYLRHHWEHAPLHFARLAHWFYSAKLAFRRRLAPAKAPDAEGIEPWELSYIESAAMCARFLQESRRPRNYEYHGLKKLTAEVGDGRSETGD